MEIKYPRTYHHPSSPAIQNAIGDDKIQYDLSFLIGENVVITEKKDGQNTSMTKNKFWTRSLESANHPSQNYVKGLWGNIKHLIPEGWRICGENVYAKHSIAYDNLEDYFLVFSIWDDKNCCLDIDETLEWCEILGLYHVPILYEGIFTEETIENITKSLDLTKQEGIVIRLAESFHFDRFQKCVIKWVRDGHVQTDKHWSTQPVIKNKLQQ